MKRISWVGLLVAGLVLAPWLCRAEEVKIGVVNINKIFASYNKVAESQADFDKFRAERQAEVDKKTEEIKKEVKPLQDKLEKQGKALSKEETEKVRGDIEKKQQEALNLLGGLRQELQQKNRELVEARVKEITDTVTKLAKDKGYSVVLNEEAVLYAPDTVNLTNEVLEILNKEAPKKEAPKTEGTKK